LRCIDANHATKTNAMNLKFDLADLQAFSAVANLGSFRAAAEAIHLSQPAFSRRIDKLELALGVKLLDRTTRRVNLTTVGRDFARKAQQILDDLDGMLLGVEDVAFNRAGLVTIACVPSATRYFLPQVVQRFHAQYPKIRIRIHDAHANEVLTVVAQGEADFGINFIGRQEADIEFKALMQERFVLACRREHPLAKKRSVKWSELSPYDFMSVGKSSGNRLLMDLALANVPDRPQCVFEARHVQTLLGLVEAGLGIAAVPQLAMATDASTSLVAVPLTHPVVNRQLGLITRRGRSLSPAAAHLYQFIADMKRGKPGPRVALA
jgi:DNA-binding transcriptional LysR family regulator